METPSCTGKRRQEQITKRTGRRQADTQLVERKQHRSIVASIMHNMPAQDAVAGQLHRGSESRQKLKLKICTVGESPGYVEKERSHGKDIWEKPSGEKQVSRVETKMNLDPDTNFATHNVRWVKL